MTTSVFTGLFVDFTTITKYLELFVCNLRKMFKWPINKNFFALIVFRRVFLMWCKHSNHKKEDNVLFCLFFVVDFLQITKYHKLFVICEKWPINTNFFEFMVFRRVSSKR